MGLTGFDRRIFFVSVLNALVRWLGFVLGRKVTPVLLSEGFVVLLFGLLLRLVVLAEVATDVGFCEVILPVLLLILALLRLVVQSRMGRNCRHGEVVFGAGQR